MRAGQVHRDQRGRPCQAQNDGANLRQEAPPVQLGQDDAAQEEGCPNICNRKHQGLKPAAEEPLVAAIGKKDAVDAGFHKNEARENSKSEHRRRWVMRVADEAVFGFERLEIGEAAFLFPQAVGKQGPIGDQDLLPLEPDLLQIAVELGRLAAFLLRLDFLGKRVELRFGFGVMLVEILLQVPRDVFKAGRRGLKARGRRRCGHIALHGVRRLRGAARWHREANGICGFVAVSLLWRPLIDIAGPVDNALVIVQPSFWVRGGAHALLNKYSLKRHKSYIGSAAKESVRPSCIAVFPLSMRARHASCGFQALW